MYTILITGCSRGLGLELVKQYSAQAAQEVGLVIATARSLNGSLSDLIAQSNDSVKFVALDVADKANVAQAGKEIQRALGGRPLDVLINSAGVYSTTEETIANMFWLQSEMGGKDADLTVPQGAEAVRSIVDSANQKDNGCFKNIHVPGWGQYDGKDLPCDFGPDESIIDLKQSSRPGPPHTDVPTQAPREASAASDTCSAADADDSNYHAIQAKSIIQLELDDSRFITIGRTSILRSALQLVSEIAEKERHQSALFAEGEPPVEPDVTAPSPPPREMLFMLLRGPSETRVQWPDHISETTYERMATALLDDSLQPNDYRYHQYCVCVYVRATVHLYHLHQSTDNEVIKRHVAQSRAAYIAAALGSIQQFNILRRPDLSTIQCLISSALLMQYLGRLNQCWILISYASKQIISLNYHRMRKTPASTEHEQEIYNAVWWCYYLDRTLSSLLGRPHSLPDLLVSPTDLIPSDPSSPFDGLIRVVLDLAQVQGRLHALSCCEGRSTKTSALETCQQLETKMHDILPRIQVDRESLPKAVHHGWIALDFCYYAIFVEVHRTRLKSSFSPLVHRLTLQYAQNSLRAFLLLFEQPAAVPDLDDPCPLFFTWTLFIYPLTPFFVVFCNVVGTLNRENYLLMERIIDSLARYRPSRHFERLLNLLQSLQRLCDPLFHEPGPDAIAHIEGLAPLLVNNHGLDPDSIDGHQSSSHSDDNMALRNMPAVASKGASSADWMMWDLINSQLPSAWLNSDFDPFSM
ncbi:hypothetical protein BDV19DRAFT_375440 [Aspergillus venezuelensis]